ncbi:MAG: hypothetical protein WCG66_06305 [bacterium]
MQNEIHPHPAADQLEMFDIVPDRPLPVPESDDESLARWLRDQSEEKLHELLEAVSKFNGEGRR